MATRPTEGQDQATKRVIQGLKDIYKSTILPLEQVQTKPREGGREGREGRRRGGGWGEEREGHEGADASLPYACLYAFVVAPALA